MKSRYSVNLIQNLDLLVIVVISALMIPLNTFDTGIFRAILGFVFLFFTPGYALVSALFPGARLLGNLERLVCSMVTSVAVVGLTGLVLNYTAFGFSLLLSITIISIFNFILLLVAFIRRLKLPDSERFSPGFKQFPSLFSSGRKSVIIACFVGIVFIGLVLGSICLVDRSGVKEPDEFYLLPVQNNAGYPRKVQIGDTVSVRAVIVNHSSQLRSYNLDVVAAGQVLSSFANIDLNSSETWDQVVNTQPINAGENQKIEYVLYVNGGKDMQDTLYIYIDVRDK